MPLHRLLDRNVYLVRGNLLGVEEDLNFLTLCVVEACNDLVAGWVNYLSLLRNSWCDGVRGCWFSLGLRGDWWRRLADRSVNCANSSTKQTSDLTRFGNLFKSLHQGQIGIVGGDLNQSLTNLVNFLFRIL